MQAHDRALAGQATIRQQLTLGVSDHAAGPELVPLLEKLHAVSSQLTLAVTIGFSRDLLDRFDVGELDAVIVRQERSRRGGKKLTEDEFGWFASPRFQWKPSEALRLATPSPPCGVRAIAGRALDKAGIAWERGVCQLRRHRGGRRGAGRPRGRAVGKAYRPLGMIDIGPAHDLP
jgi:DNA-binding transcriptional LysR family regulator